MKLSIESDKVLETISKYPQTKDILESLFPEVRKDNSNFCKIGSVLKRKDYNNLYALFAWNGEVRFLNISNNSFWNKDRNIKMSQLYDERGDFVTVYEFEQLTKMKCSNFEIVTA